MINDQLRTESRLDLALEVDPVIWRPNKGPQSLLVSCPVYEVFYGGARGGGKSDGLLGDFMRGVNKYGYAWRGIIFRRSYPELEELIRRSYEIYLRAFPGAWFSRGSKTWYFPGGATLKMRFVEHDNDIMMYQGHAYSWIGFDELTHWPSSFCYDTLKACARSPHGAPVRVRGSGNPGGPGHQWVKARFIDVVPPYTIYADPEEDGLERVFIPAFVGDNPKWAEKDPDYVKRLRALPDKALRRAWLYGDWDAFVGQVFEEWNRAIHQCRPFRIPAWWTKFTSCDWGYATPFSIGWYAVDTEERVWRYREWYGQDGKRSNKGIRWTADKVGMKMLEIEEAAGEKITYRVLSPDAWQKRGQTGPSVSETFEDVKIQRPDGTWNRMSWDKADNDRINGLHQCHLRLKPQPGNELGQKIRPMFVNFDTCVRFGEKVPPLGYDKTRVEDVDKDSEDHLYEEWRYAMMSRPIASSEPKPKVPKWLQKKGRRQKKSWRVV